MPDSPPILWLSTDSWDDPWTRKQRFARLFAARGRQVLYVEGPQHWISVLRGLPGSLARLARARQHPRQVEPNLWVATPPPLVPFFQRFDWLNRLNARLLGPWLARRARRLGFVRPLVWVYPPWAAPHVAGLDRSFLVYDCVDEWSSFRGLLDPEVVRRQEDELLRLADLVVVTTDTLAAGKSKVARRVAVVPNAADAEHFRRALDPATLDPREVRSLPRPRLGFIGGIQYWIDFELLEALARARPSWPLVLVGPVGRLARTERLRALGNVHFLGRKAYDELPGFLRSFDVCLLPFRDDETGRNVSPLKLYEYLAAGREVVSADLPAVRPFAHLVRIAATPEEFVARVDEALAAGSSRREALLDEARRHTWEARFEKILTELPEVVS